MTTTANDKAKAMEDLAPIFNWGTSVVGSKKNIGGVGAFYYLQGLEGIDPNWRFIGLCLVAAIWLAAWGFADGMSRKYAPADRS